MTLALACLGLVAGMLTTLAGQGGGLFLLLVCSAIMGPHAALAITAPALLLGNLHRATLFRRSIDRRFAIRIVAFALPGAVLGGFLADVIPAWALQVLLVVLTVLAIVRALGLLLFEVPHWALRMGGLVIGVMTGTAGGAGVLLAPLLLSAGLRGSVFIGTISVIAFTTHVGRVLAYAWSGLFTRELALPTVAVALAIFAGNALGGRLRSIFSERTTTRLEYGLLVVCVGVSIAGFV